MADHRQSALLLHGLALADQRWILARIPAADQRILREHLAELRNLGIPTDGDFAAAANAPRGSRKPADPLRKATGAEIRAILADEPVWMLRRLLALDNWPWRREFLDGLMPAVRQRIAASQPATMKRKLADSLRTQLAYRLARADSGHRSAGRSRSIPLVARDVARKVVRRWL